MQKFRLDRAASLDHFAVGHLVEVSSKLDRSQKGINPRQLKSWTRSSMHSWLTRTPRLCQAMTALLLRLVVKELLLLETGMSRWLDFSLESYL